MVGKALWKSLKEYADCNDLIASLETKIAEYKAVISNHEKAILELEVSVSGSKELLAKKRLDVKRYEADAETLKQRIAQKKKSLEHAASKKTYDALEHEIEQLNTLQNELEEKLIESWSSLEKAIQESHQEVSELPEKKLAHENAIVADNLSIEHVRQQINALQEQNKKLSADIPPLWLTRFKRMHESVQHPLVPLAHASCSACYYAVVQQDLTKLREGGLITCRSCYRFLYLDPEIAQEEKLQKATGR